MRHGTFGETSDAATLALHPDLGLNWMHFANDHYHRNGFEPTPSAWQPAAWDETLRGQWQEWRKALWRETVSISGEGASERTERLGCDAPSFTSLTTRIDCAQMRERCVMRWPQFLDWWNREGAQRALAELTLSAPVISNTERIRSTLPPATRVTLYVVGLSAVHSFGFSRHHSGGRTDIVAGITAGLLRDEDRFPHWAGVLSSHST